MVSVIISVLVGMIIPIAILVNGSNADKGEKLATYSLLGILGIIYIAVWGRDTVGFNFFLIGLIALIVLLNLRNPELITYALTSIKDMVPKYLDKLQTISKTTDDELSKTFNDLLSAIIKVNVVALLLGLTPIYGQKQSFCVVIGTVLYLFIAHIFLIKENIIVEALKGLQHSIRLKLHLVTLDVDREENNIDEPEGDEDEILESKPKKRAIDISSSKRERNDSRGGTEQKLKKKSLVVQGDTEPNPNRRKVQLPGDDLLTNSGSSALKDDVLPTRHRSSRDDDEVDFLSGRRKSSGSGEISSRSRRGLDRNEIQGENKIERRRSRLSDTNGDEDFTERSTSNSEEPLIRRRRSVGEELAASRGHTVTEEEPTMGRYQMGEEPTIRRRQLGEETTSSRRRSVEDELRRGRSRTTIDEDATSNVLASLKSDLNDDDIQIKPRRRGGISSKLEEDSTIDRILNSEVLPTSRSIPTDDLSEVSLDLNDSREKPSPRLSPLRPVSNTGETRVRPVPRN